MGNLKPSSASSRSRRELRIAVSCEAYEFVQRLAKLRRCSPAEVVETALRAQHLVQAVETLLERAATVDDQIQSIASHLLDHRRSRR